MHSHFWQKTAQVDQICLRRIQRDWRKWFLASWPAEVTTVIRTRHWAGLQEWVAPEKWKKGKWEKCRPLGVPEEWRKEDKLLDCDREISVWCGCSCRFLLTPLPCLSAEGSFCQALCPSPTMAQTQGYGRCEGTWIRFFWIFIYLVSSSVKNNSICHKLVSCIAVKLAFLWFVTIVLFLFFGLSQDEFSLHENL